MTQEQFDAVIKGWKIFKVATKIAYNVLVVGVLVFLLFWNAHLQNDVARHERNEVVLSKMINLMSQELDAVAGVITGKPVPHGDSDHSDPPAQQHPPRGPTTSL